MFAYLRVDGIMWSYFKSMFYRSPWALPVVGKQI